MKQPRNLLKQESDSASTYVSISFRMYHDEKQGGRESKAAIEKALIPYVLSLVSEKNIKKLKIIFVYSLCGYYWRICNP
jgi:hypothetical protein